MERIIESIYRNVLLLRKRDLEKENEEIISLLKGFDERYEMITIGNKYYIRYKPTNCQIINIVGLCISKQQGEITFITSDSIELKLDSGIILDAKELKKRIK